MHPAADTLRLVFQLSGRRAGDARGIVAVAIVPRVATIAEKDRCCYVSG